MDMVVCRINNQWHSKRNVRQPFLSYLCTTGQARSRLARGEVVLDCLFDCKDGPRFEPRRVNTSKSPITGGTYTMNSVRPASVLSSSVSMLARIMICSIQLVSCVGFARWRPRLAARGHLSRCAEGYTCRMECLKSPLSYNAK